MTVTDTTAVIRGIAARITFDDGTDDTIHGIPAVAFYGDDGIVRVGQTGTRTVVSVTRFGGEQVRTFVSTAGAEGFIAGAMS